MQTAIIYPEASHMPNAAPSICPAPGCASIVSRAKPCPRHTRHILKEATRTDETRGRDRFYHTARWLKFRKWFLSTNCEEAGCVHAFEHPLCQDCGAEGRVTPATDVDHIVPRAQGGADLDATNVRGLCRSCHSRRTLADRRAGGR